MLDETTALGTICKPNLCNKDAASRLQHWQGLSAVQSAFISVAGEYTLQNAELVSQKLFSFITGLPKSRQNSVELFELLQGQLLHLHWFLVKVAEETKVYLLDHNVRQILAKYASLQPETAQPQVVRWLWIVYCAYFRYETGEYNSLGVCRLILKFLQSARQTSTPLWDYFVTIEKQFLKAATVNPAKWDDLSCFRLKPNKVSTVTVVDLTEEDSSETPEDLKYQGTLDRLKKLRNDLELHKKQQQQKRRNGFITRSNLKRNTVICLSDDEDDVIYVDPDRDKTPEQNIREAITEATGLLSKYSNREMTIKVQKNEVRIQIQSPESPRSESVRSPEEEEEPECPPRTFIWPYCYAPAFQTMQGWFGYHPGDGRAYPRPLLDPWRTPMGPPPQWAPPPYPMMEPPMHRVDCYAPYWSYSRPPMESPESHVLPDHKPIIEKKDEERTDSPPEKPPDKELEQSVPHQPEEKPPDEDLLLLSDGCSETYTEVDEDALLDDSSQQPEPSSNPEPEPAEPVLIIQDVVIKTAVPEEEKKPVVEPQSETLYTPEGAPAELPEVRNNLLWFSNVILSSTVPEPEETPKGDEIAFVHPEILASEEVDYAQEIEVEETVEKPGEDQFYPNALQETSEDTALKPARVPEKYLQSPTENFSLLRYESGEAQRPETTDSSDSEIRLKIDERGDSSPEHPLVTPVRPYRTKAEMKQGIQTDESDDDVPLKFHKGTKLRNRRPSSSPRGRKRNGSARRKTESQQYTSKLRSRSQSTSKEEEPITLENMSPVKPRGRPKKVPPPVLNAPEPSALIETVLVTSKTLLVEESCATLNLATTPPKKRMALLRKMNKLLDDTTKRLKERQGVAEDSEDMFTFDSDKILEVQQEVEIVMTEKKPESNDRVLRSNRDFEGEECLSLKKPEVLKSQKSKSSKSGKKSKKAVHSQVVDTTQIPDLIHKTEPDQISKKTKPPRTSSKSPSRMQSDNSKPLFKGVKKSKNEVLTLETVKSLTNKSPDSQVEKKSSVVNLAVEELTKKAADLYNETQLSSKLGEADYDCEKSLSKPPVLVVSSKLEISMENPTTGKKSLGLEVPTNNPKPLEDTFKKTRKSSDVEVSKMKSLRKSSEDLVGPTKPLDLTEELSLKKHRRPSSLSVENEAVTLDNSKKLRKSTNCQIMDNKREKSVSKSPTLVISNLENVTRKSLDLKSSQDSLKKSRRGSDVGLEKSIKSKKVSTNEIVNQHSNSNRIEPTKLLDLPEETSSRKPKSKPSDLDSSICQQVVELEKCVENKPEKTATLDTSHLKPLEKTSKKSRKLLSNHSGQLQSSEKDAELIKPSSDIGVSENVSNIQVQEKSTNESPSAKSVKVKTTESSLTQLGENSRKSPNQEQGKSTVPTNHKKETPKVKKTSHNLNESTKKKSRRPSEHFEESSGSKQKSSAPEKSRKSSNSLTAHFDVSSRKIQFDLPVKSNGQLLPDLSNKQKEVSTKKSKSSKSKSSKRAAPDTTEDVTPVKKPRKNKEEDIPKLLNGTRVSPKVHLDRKDLTPQIEEETKSKKSKESKVESLTKLPKELQPQHEELSSCSHIFETVETPDVQCEETVGETVTSQNVEEIKLEELTCKEEPNVKSSEDTERNPEQLTKTEVVEEVLTSTAAEEIKDQENTQKEEESKADVPLQGEEVSNLLFLEENKTEIFKQTDEALTAKAKQTNMEDSTIGVEAQFDSTKNPEQDVSCSKKKSTKVKNELQEAVEALSGQLNDSIKDLEEVLHSTKSDISKKESSEVLPDAKKQEKEDSTVGVAESQSNQEEDVSTEECFKKETTTKVEELPSTFVETNISITSKVQLDEKKPKKEDSTIADAASRPEQERIKSEEAVTTEECSEKSEFDTSKEEVTFTVEDQLEKKTIIAAVESQSEQETIKSEEVATEEQSTKEETAKVQDNPESPKESLNTGITAEVQLDEKKEDSRVVIAETQSSQEEAKSEESLHIEEPFKSDILKQETTITPQVQLDEKKQNEDSAEIQPGQETTENEQSSTTEELCKKSDKTTITPEVQLDKEKEKKDDSSVTVAAAISEDSLTTEERSKKSDSSKAKMKDNSKNLKKLLNTPITPEDEKKQRKEDSSIAVEETQFGQEQTKSEERPKKSYVSKGKTARVKLEEKKQKKEDSSIPVEESHSEQEQSKSEDTVTTEERPKKSYVSKKKEKEDSSIVVEETQSGQEETKSEQSLTTGELSKKSHISKGKTEKVKGKKEFQIDEKKQKKEDSIIAIADCRSEQEKLFKKADISKKKAIKESLNSGTISKVQSDEKKQKKKDSKVAVAESQLGQEPTKSEEVETTSESTTEKLISESSVAIAEIQSMQEEAKSEESLTTEELFEKFDKTKEKTSLSPEVLIDKSKKKEDLKVAETQSRREETKSEESSTTEELFKKPDISEKKPIKVKDRSKSPKESINSATTPEVDEKKQKSEDSRIAFAESQSSKEAKSLIIEELFENYDTSKKKLTKVKSSSKEALNTGVTPEIETNEKKQRKNDSRDAESKPGQKTTKSEENVTVEEHLKEASNPAEVEIDEKRQKKDDSIAVAETQSGQETNKNAKSSTTEELFKKPDISKNKTTKVKDKIKSSKDSINSATVSEVDEKKQKSEDSSIAVAESQSSKEAKSQIIEELFENYDTSKKKLTKVKSSSKETLKTRVPPEIETDEKKQKKKDSRDAERKSGQKPTKSEESVTIEEHPKGTTNPVEIEIDEKRQKKDDSIAVAETQSEQVTIKNAKSSTTEELFKKPDISKKKTTKVKDRSKSPKESINSATTPEVDEKKQKSEDSSIAVAETQSSKEAKSLIIEELFENYDISKKKPTKVKSSSKETLKTGVPPEIEVDEKKQKKKDSRDAESKTGQKTTKNEESVTIEERSKGTTINSEVEIDEKRQKKDDSIAVAETQSGQETIKNARSSTTEELFKKLDNSKKKHTKVKDKMKSFKEPINSATTPEVEEKKEKSEDSSITVAESQSSKEAKSLIIEELFENYDISKKKPTKVKSSLKEMLKTGVPPDIEVDEKKQKKKDSRDAETTKSEENVTVEERSKGVTINSEVEIDEKRQKKVDSIAVAETQSRREETKSEESLSTEEIFKKLDISKKKPTKVKDSSESSKDSINSATIPEVDEKKEKSEDSSIAVAESQSSKEAKSLIIEELFENYDISKKKPAKVKSSSKETLKAEVPLEIETDEKKQKKKDSKVAETTKSEENVTVEEHSKEATSPAEVEIDEKRQKESSIAVAETQSGQETIKNAKSSTTEELFKKINNSKKKPTKVKSSSKETLKTGVSPEVEVDEKKQKKKDSRDAESKSGQKTTKSEESVIIEERSKGVTINSEEQTDEKRRKKDDSVTFAETQSEQETIKNATSSTTEELFKKPDNSKKKHTKVKDKIKNSKESINSATTPEVDEKKQKTEDSSIAVAETQSSKEAKSLIIEELFENYDISKKKPTKETLKTGVPPDIEVDEKKQKKKDSRNAETKSGQKTTKSEESVIIEERYKGTTIASKVEIDEKRQKESSIEVAETKSGQETIKNAKSSTTEELFKKPNNSKKKPTKSKDNSKSSITSEIQLDEKKQKKEISIIAEASKSEERSKKSDSKRKTAKVKDSLKESNTALTPDAKVEKKKQKKEESNSGHEATKSEAAELPKKSDISKGKTPKLKDKTIPEIQVQEATKSEESATTEELPVRKKKSKRKDRSKTSKELVVVPQVPSKPKSTSNKKKNEDSSIATEESQQLKSKEPEELAGVTKQDCSQPDNSSESRSKKKFRMAKEALEEDLTELKVKEELNSKPLKETLKDQTDKDEENPITKSKNEVKIEEISELNSGTEERGKNSKREKEEAASVILEEDSKSSEVTSKKPRKLKLKEDSEIEPPSKLKKYNEETTTREEIELIEDKKSTELLDSKLPLSGRRQSFENLTRVSGLEKTLEESLKQPPTSPKGEEIVHVPMDLSVVKSPVVNTTAASRILESPPKTTKKPSIEETVLKLKQQICKNTTSEDVVGTELEDHNKLLREIEEIVTEMVEKVAELCKSLDWSVDSLGGPDLSESKRKSDPATPQKHSFKSIADLLKLDEPVKEQQVEARKEPEDSESEKEFKHVTAECEDSVNSSEVNKQQASIKPKVESSEADKVESKLEIEEDSISESTSSENSIHPIECLVPDFDNELLITDDSLSQDPLKISDVLNEVEISSVALNEDSVWIPKVQVEFLPQIPYEFQEVKTQSIHKVEEGLKAGEELQLPMGRKKKKRRRSEDRSDRRREEKKSSRSSSKSEEVSKSSSGSKKRRSEERDIQKKGAEENVNIQKEVVEDTAVQVEDTEPEVKEQEDFLPIAESTITKPAENCQDYALTEFTPPPLQDQNKINIINQTIIKPGNLVPEVSTFDIPKPTTLNKRKSTETLEDPPIKKMKPNDTFPSEYIPDLKSSQSEACLEDTKILMGDECLQNYLFLDENGCSFSGITETVASSSVAYVDFAFDHVTTDTSSEPYTPNAMVECEITNFVPQTSNTGFDVFKASSDHSYADAVKSHDTLSEADAKKLPEIDSKPSMDQFIGLLQPSEAEDMLEKPSINIGDPVAMEYENNWPDGLDFKTLDYGVLENFSLEDELVASKNSDMFNQVEKFVMGIGIDKDDFEIGLPVKILRRNEPFTLIDAVTFEQPREQPPKPAKLPVRMSTRNLPHKQISVRPLQDMITKKTGNIPDNYMEDSNTSESSCSGLDIDSWKFSTQISPSAAEAQVKKDTPKNPPGRKRAPAKTPLLTVPVRKSEKTKPCPPPPKKKVTSTSPQIQPNHANSPRVHRSMNSYMPPLVEESSATRTRKSPKGSPRGTTVKSMPTLTIEESNVKTRFGSRTTTNVKISGATDNATPNWDGTSKPRQKPSKTPPVDPFDLLKTGLINPSFEERLRASQGRDKPVPPPVVEKPYTPSKPTLAKKTNKNPTNPKQSNEEDWMERFAEELKKRGRSESCL